MNGVLKEENRVPTSPGAQHSVFKGQLGDKPGISVQDKHECAFQSAPLNISHISTPPQGFVFGLSLLFISIYHSVYQCRGVSEPCHQSSALCVALTDPLHLTAPVWLLLARRWRLIDGCPNSNYSASLSLAWCGHERAAG